MQDLNLKGRQVCSPDNLRWDQVLRMSKLQRSVHYRDSVVPQVLYQGDYEICGIMLLALDRKGMSGTGLWSSHLPLIIASKTKANLYYVTNRKHCERQTSIKKIDQWTFYTAHPLSRSHPFWKKIRFISNLPQNHPHVLNVRRNKKRKKATYPMSGVRL